MIIFLSLLSHQIWAQLLLILLVYFILIPSTRFLLHVHFFCFSNSRVFIKRERVRGKVYVAVEKAYYIEQNEILLLLRHHHVIGFVHKGNNNIYQPAFYFVCLYKSIKDSMIILSQPKINISVKSFFARVEFHLNSIAVINPYITHVRSMIRKVMNFTFTWLILDWSSSLFFLSKFIKVIWYIIREDGSNKFKLKLRITRIWYEIKILQNFSSSVIIFKFLTTLSRAKLLILSLNKTERK